MSAARRRLPPRFVVTTTAFAWIAIALASAALWPVYQSGRYVILVLAALVLGTIIAHLGARFRWPSYAVVLAGFAALLLGGVPLAVPGEAVAGVLPSLEGMRQLIAALALGWKQLLTIQTPVGAYQALLVPALVLVLAATIISLTVALRARWGELGAIPPVLLFVAGIVLGPARVPWPVPLTLALLVVLLAWLIWRRRLRRRESIAALASAAPDAEGRPLETAGERGFVVRAALAGTLILALAGAGSVAAAVALPPTGERQVLRTALQQPFDPRQYPSPLAGFRHYLRDGEADAPQLTVVGLPKDARIRIATLDTYDGIVYAVGSDEVDAASGTFVRIPQSVDRSSERGRPVSARISVQGYTGVWVPTIGDVSSIEFQGPDARSLDDDYFFNQTTGTAADLRRLRDGDAYDLTGVLPDQPTTGQLSAATPGSAQVPRAGIIPPDLATHLDGYVQGKTTPGSRLLAAIDGMRKEGYISHGIRGDEPPSRSGHAADRIAELFTAPQMIGDAEQYAVAGALMARQLGFPARVVFGFAPRQTGGGSITVSGSDITAWIEVDTAEYGWVAIDPVPPVRPIPQEQPQDPNKVARPESIVPPPPDKADPNLDQSTPDSSKDSSDGPNQALVVLLQVLRIAGWALLVLLVLAAPFLLVIAAKARRRRRRRRAATPLDRIRGGWDEFADTAIDHGFDPPPSATRTEVAGTVGLLPARVLAAVADRAVFAPGEADPREADRVWDAVTELRASLDDGLTRRRRLRALVSLRSFARYHVPHLLRHRGAGPEGER
ncbi:transglutaminaseTgpA domain-containing protein [Pseudolysinimonas sp.]|uniref:transglutaminaseTgpA domain-containing protein n=1 Tax=Pseudolysinimonas sp. TaxID=2680009 RepID=UPI003F7D2AF1